YEAWMIAATETGERTLRDSAGKRSWLPESFLIIDEALKRTERNIRGMKFNKEIIRTTLEKFTNFSATELILEDAVRAGADRQEMHELLRVHSNAATAEMHAGRENPIRGLIVSDPHVLDYVSANHLDELFSEAQHHVGDAPERANTYAQYIRETIAEDRKKEEGGEDI
ncbi:MAG: adenylosuccinate lyase, partial [Candidatus Roizmanbacteria bacterium]|nr:adenylosuccinate lyase [Candidatus Roizmanbacteria bacterium]